MTHKEQQKQLLELKYKLVDNLSSYALKADLGYKRYHECLSVINNLTDISMTNKMMLGLFTKWLIDGGISKLEIIFNLAKINSCLLLLDYINFKGVNYKYKY